MIESVYRYFPPARVGTFHIKSKGKIALLRKGVAMLEKLIKKQNNNDSIYNRRLQRGEIPDTPEFAWERRVSKIEQQKQEIQDLKIENRKLLRELETLKKQISTMQYVHSIDDLIDSMAQQKSVQTGFNPFAMFGANGGTTTTGNTASDSDTYTEKLLSPEYQFEGEIPSDDDEIASIGEVISSTMNFDDIDEAMKNYRPDPFGSYDRGRTAARLLGYVGAAARYI